MSHVTRAYLNDPTSFPPGYNPWNDLDYSECRSSYLIRWGMTIDPAGADIYLNWTEVHGCKYDQSLDPNCPDHPPMYDFWNAEKDELAQMGLEQELISGPRVGEVGVAGWELNLFGDFYLEVPCDKPCSIHGATVGTESRRWLRGGDNTSGQLLRDFIRDWGGFQAAPFAVNSGINNILGCLAGQGVWTGTQNWPQNRIDAINECYRKQMGRINEALKAEPNCDIANYYCPDTTLVPDYSNLDSYNYRSQMEKTMSDRGFDTVYSIGKNDPIFLEFLKKEKQLRGLLN